MNTTAHTVAPTPLTVTGLTKRFGQRTLWQDVTFTRQPGTMTAVTGPSGAGKTTLLNCVGLLEEADAGTVTFGSTSVTETGRGIDRRAQHTLLRDTLGFLFQNYGLVETWTVERNLTVALKNKPGSHADKQRLTADALSRVGLAGYERKPVYTLSGGEQQRVALARLILKQPAVILADEPTSALDHANARIVMDALRQAADQGAVVLISTHSDAVTAACDTTLPIGGAHPATTR